MSSASLSSHEFRVLIVEDDEFVLESLQRLFDLVEDYKFKLFTAMDCENATRLIEEVKPHLLITDQILPGGLGSELAKHCKDINEKSVVIGVTGNRSSLDAFKSNGASFVLSKPFNSNLLVQIVTDRMKFLFNNYRESLEL